MFYDLQMEVEAAKDDQVSDFFPYQTPLLLLYSTCSSLAHKARFVHFQGKYLECFKGGLILESFSLWLKSLKQGAKSLSLAYFV